MHRLIGIASLLLLMLGGTTLWLADRTLDRPVGEPARNYLLDVREGSALSTVLDQLAGDGVLAWPRLLSVYARWRGEAASIQAGEYQLDPEQSPRELLAMLVAGRVRLHAFTIVEGWTVRELLAALDDEPLVTQTLAAVGPEALAVELGFEEASAEGLFLPETYFFARGMTDRELLLRANTMLREQLELAWAAREGGLPLDEPYQALVLASLIERETALAAERPLIAGVFTRRLQLGMRLQTDPAVIYGIGPEFNGDLTRRDLRRDTPYNTYTRNGLPPTPIALAGVDSLRAAVSPADGEALYFVATGLGDGSHTFTATLEEHNAAVARYLARLRSDRNGG